jgi:uncharacterized RDD family membrane protein YckC
MIENYSPVYRRGFAFIFDRILFFILAYYSLKFIFLWNNFEEIMNYLILLYIFLFIPLTIYAESSKFQGGIGKNLLKIKVVNLEGKMITFKTAFFRQFFRELYSISIIIPLIALILASFDKRKQFLHDKVVDTLVVLK